METGYFEVVCAVLEREGRYLCARRGRLMKQPLKWEFPGGKVEAGENPETALQREIREELGVEVTIGSALGAHDYAYAPGRILRLLPYRCSLADGQEPVAVEHAELAWMAPADMHGLDWLEADLSIVGQLAAEAAG